MNGRKVSWYFVFSCLFVRLDPKVRNKIWVTTISVTAMVIASNVSLWKLLNHNFVQSSFSKITNHIDSNIWENLELKILRKWINMRAYSFLVKYHEMKIDEGAQKIISCTKNETCTSKIIAPIYDDISLIIACFFFVQTNLVFKFNLVLIK